MMKFQEIICTSRHETIRDDVIDEMRSGSSILMKKKKEGRISIIALISFLLWIFNRYFTQIEWLKIFILHYKNWGDIVYKPIIFMLMW